MNDESARRDDSTKTCPNGCTKADGTRQPLSSMGCYRLTANGLETWWKCPKCKKTWHKAFYAYRDTHHE